MIYILLGIALGLFFFIATVKAYTLGLKHGKQLVSAIIPTITTSPLKLIKQHLENEKLKIKEDLTQQGIQNVATYNPYEDERVIE